MAFVKRRRLGKGGCATLQALRARPPLRRSGLLYLRVEDIAPNPMQPRKVFEEEALRELSESIRSYGVLHPLTVRLRCGKYELVAGERRLRAARLAGLREVPCMVVDVDLEDAGLLALVENLQRKDLDFLEEARGLQQMIRLFGMSQEEAARRIGRSQSAVANKLRLLKLPEDVLESLRENGLSERHGRALLRLPDAESQRAALETVLEKEMTVAATDAYVDALLASPEPPPRRPEARRSFVMKDVRVFLNSLTHGLDLMKQGGIAAGLRREETEDALILTISIPKSKNVT
ncbi:MAG: ParB/RepB/Spo0J family partition protein [Oscillospiraceae bacterium]|nr:ParB/RepB/Spo0J family partition protein [Oscillospiraceae bacterium]